MAAIKWSQGARKMAEWFKEVKIKGPIKINAYSTITDPAKYISTNISIILFYIDKPQSAPFLPAYMRLYELKKHIENEQSGTADSHP